MKKRYTILLLLLCTNICVQAQSGKQKKADRLFEDFAYMKATELYKELISKNYEVTKNSLKLGDAYMKLRSPENAVHYYGDVMEDTTISPEYYYKYAQALRGVKRYEESRQWLRKYMESGRESGEIKAILSNEKDEYKSKETYRVQPADFNSGVSDFGVFVREGKLYFVSARAQGVNVKEKTYSWNGEPFLDLYVMEKASGSIAPVAGEINTKLHDGPLVISPDGNTMYFTRNNYLGKKEGKRDKNKTNHLKLYMAKRSGDSWTQVQELPFNSNEYSVGHPALSPDGGTLYFASDMPGGMGGTDLYKVPVTGNNTYGSIENMGAPVNTEFDETFPFVDKEARLYFSSNGHAGLGLFDIFKFEEGQVTNLGEPVNSSLDDFAYFQIADSKEGYISSNREANSDNIFVFNKLNQLILKGQVTDAVNEKPIAQATVRLMDQDQKQLAFLQTDSLGNYQTQVNRDMTYPIEAKEIRYQTYTATVNTAAVADDKDELVYNIALQPVADVEYLAEIDNIYFDFDKSNIRPDAAKELDKLVQLMKEQYPQLVIEIGSHTDRRGSNAYNEKLAQRRAKATYDYLIAHGIAKERIKRYQGFGENKPAIDCERCSEKEHQLNRRSMFSVVKMEETAN